MMKNGYKYNKFIRNHDLVNRIIDMLVYLGLLDEDNLDYKWLKGKINYELKDISYIETISKVFEDHRKQNYKNVELRCNLSALIDELNLLKQYLVK